MTVCVIGVYFGELPDYFPLWLRSCEKNEAVDFFVFTDAVVQNPPHNVRIIPMTLAEMKAVAQEKLGMELVMDTPFKCCDYKPVFGLIFEDYVSQYDYWGHCDFDMIFGDIMHFLREYEVEKYDKFLPLGHLAFYRNTQECNQRYQLTPKAGNDYRYAFAQNRTTQFDELGGINAIYDEYGFPFFRKRIFADISVQWDRVKLAENYIDSDDVNYPYQVFYWQDGKVFRGYLSNGKLCREEFIYIHIKKRKFALPEFECNDVRSFYICPHAFAQRPVDEVITKAVIQKYNCYHGGLYELLERVLLRKLKARCKKLLKTAERKHNGK